METKMNRYQCSINHFTGAKTLFEVEAADKASALIAAKEYAHKHIQWGGNFFENTIKVIKKIQKKEKQKCKM